MERRKMEKKKANSHFEFLFSKDNLLNSKRSQVTIFIILALIIVVAIILLFLLFRQPGVKIEDIENPQAYIQSCTREVVEEAIKILSEQGGDIAPEGSIMYKGKNVTYLCYNENYYKTCINQRPMLIEHIQNEITDYIIPKVNSCFNSLKSKLEEKNYIIEMGGMDIKTRLKSKQVAIDIKRNFKMSKREEMKEFKNFEIDLAHPIYELAEIAMEIANQEAHYCNFETLGFMIFYPEYDIQKRRVGESDTIYEIMEIRTNKKFRFAIRSCALPPGL